jgi:hypothetical protein
MLSTPVEADAATGTPGWRTQSFITRAIRQALRQKCPIIVADNVAEHTIYEAMADSSFAHDKKGRPNAEFSYARIGCQLPPFPLFFIEWKVPAAIRDVYLEAVRASGWLVWASKPSAESLARVPQTEYELVYVHCYEHRDGRPGVSGNACRVLVDAQGNHLCEATTAEPDGGGAADSGADNIIAEQAIGFMNCRNVKRIDATPAEAPSAKWCRRQRVPELKYHVLQIDPRLGTKPRAGERKTEDDRSGKALHICRGHFAHYIDDGTSQGLFGRHQFGAFWVTAHTRGSLEHGRVISTYNVKTPA